MDDMRLVFIVVGLLAILALLLHGLWSLRRNSPAKIQNRRVKPGKPSRKAGPEPAGDKAEPQLGSQPEPEMVSEPRVVSETPIVAEPSQPSLLDEDTAAMVVTQEPVKKAARRAPVRKEPVVGDQSEQIDLFAEPEAPEAPKADPVPEVKAEPMVTQAPASLFTDSDHTDTPVAEAASAEPTEEQVEMTLEPAAEEAVEDAPAVQAQKEPEPEPEPKDVLVLYVTAKRGPIQGAELLPNLLTQGFKFGDMEIFHRHLNTAGTGPVLFSLANMRQPGTFDLDSMEQFSTDGVVLFMTLPCKGDARVGFSLMEGAARGLAELHGGEVLDDRREPWCPNAKANYLQRIQQLEQGAALV